MQLHDAAPMILTAAYMAAGMTSRARRVTLLRVHGLEAA